MQWSPAKRSAEDAVSGEDLHIHRTKAHGYSVRLIRAGGEKRKSLASGLSSEGLNPRLAGSRARLALTDEPNFALSFRRV